MFGEEGQLSNASALQNIMRDHDHCWKLSVTEVNTVSCMLSNLNWACKGMCIRRDLLQLWTLIQSFCKKASKQMVYGISCCYLLCIQNIIWLAEERHVPYLLADQWNCHFLLTHQLSAWPPSHVCRARSYRLHLPLSCYWEPWLYLTLLAGINMKVCTRVFKHGKRLVIEASIHLIQACW